VLEAVFLSGIVTVKTVMASEKARLTQHQEHNLQLQSVQMKVRDTAITAIVITDSQIDHVTGLLTLREHNKPWDIYCTDAVKGDLTTGFPVFNILSHFRGVNHHEIKTDESIFTIPTAAGLEFTAVPLLSNAPPYSPHRDNTVPGDNVGMNIKDTRTGQSLFYAPGLGVAEPHVLEYMRNADCILVDGTVWTDDE